MRLLALLWGEAFEVLRPEPGISRHHLRVHRDWEIDTAYIRKSHQVDEDIADFLTESSVERLLIRQISRTLRREPLQQLSQLTHLTNERKGKGLGVMELLPVPVSSEDAHAVPKASPAVFRHVRHLPVDCRGAPLT